MRGFLLLTILLLAAVIPAAAFAQGVVPAEYTPGVIRIGGEPDMLSRTDHAALAQLPVSDAEKWRIEVFSSQGCGPCAALKSAFERDPMLRALKEQTHFSIHDLSRESQRRHWRNFKVTQYPTIVLSPPRNSEVFPYAQVFRQAGYDGNAPALGRRMLDAVRRFLDKHQQWQTPGPGPRVEPKPANPFDRIRPFVPRVDPDAIPDFPPPRPDDEVPVPPDDQSATYPQEPTITIVIDPQGIGEKIKARAAEAIAGRLADSYGGAHKIRTLRLAEAQEIGLPVRAIDTPALVGSREGRMTAFLAGSVVPLLMADRRAAPEDPDDSGVWGAGLMAAIVGGGTVSILLIVAGVVLLVVWLIRRQSGEDAAANPDGDGYQFGDYTKRILAQFQAAQAKREAAEADAERAKKQAARAAEDTAEDAKRRAAEAEAAAESLK